MPEKFINITKKTLYQYLEDIRPPENVRAQLDIGYDYDGRTVIFYEIRPRWNNPEEILKLPFAKIIYTKSRQIWKLYWMRANGKWNAYTPFPESTHLKELLDCIEEDKIGAFKG